MGKLLRPVLRLLRKLLSRLLRHLLRVLRSLLRNLLRTLLRKLLRLLRDVVVVAVAGTRFCSLGSALGDRRRAIFLLILDGVCEKIMDLEIKMLNSLGVSLGFSLLGGP